MSETRKTVEFTLMLITVYYTGYFNAKNWYAAYAIAFGLSCVFVYRIARHQIK